jgi:hypothetical protein
VGVQNSSGSRIPELLCDCPNGYFSQIDYSLDCIGMIIYINLFHKIMNNRSFLIIKKRVLLGALHAQIQATVSLV